MKKTMMITIPYKPHPAQKQFHDSIARFRTLDSGRRFGKSHAAVNEAIKFAAQKPNSMIWVVAPVFAQAMINWRKFKYFLPKEIIKGPLHKTEKYIELINGSTIWIKSGDNPDTLRGEGIDLVIVDEAAMVKKEVWEEALRPALSDKRQRATTGFLICGLGDKTQSTKTMRAGDSPHLQTHTLNRSKLRRLGRHSRK